ncbi:MAG: hypothetical protein N2044_13220, partial [Cyclobacteriaceae bacterium]|nr:hypothetical protein [Cyclobacteriaceae bacterium]
MILLSKNGLKINSESKSQPKNASKKAAPGCQRTALKLIVKANHNLASSSTSSALRCQRTALKLIVKANHNWFHHGANIQRLSKNGLKINSESKSQPSCVSLVIPCGCQRTALKLIVKANHNCFHVMA